ncbi:hypothetical protein MRX96_032542 [Rhipicephalus microplus]
MLLLAAASRKGLRNSLWMAPPGIDGGPSSDRADTDQGQSVSHSGERRRFLARRRASPGHEPRRRNFSNIYPEKAMPKIGDATSRQKKMNYRRSRQSDGTYCVRGNN